MASKTTGTKKNAKQSTAKKRQPTKKTSAKSAKSAKTTRKNTTSKAVPQEESFLATEILIWVTLAVGILLTISNFGLAGAFGRKIAALQQGMMGWMAYVFPLLLFCGVAFVVSNKGNRIAYIKTVAGVVLLVQCCVLFELIDEKGGSVGKAIAVRLVPAIGKVGTYVVVIILMVICVVLITEKSILKGMKIGGEKARQNNMRITCDSLTNTEIKPEEIFSFCNTVGKATKEKGYQEADVYVDGEKKQGLGGGNCQVSTTLYNAVLKVDGLEIIERHEHSGYVPYIEKGKDAAVAYGSYDFKFKNNTNKTIKIIMECQEKDVTAKIIEM